MASLEKTIRCIPQVSLLAFLNHTKCRILEAKHAARRDTPRRILSLASESQPEPDLVQEDFSQFARVDSGFLAWNFSLHDAHGQELGHVGRNFRGFGREVSSFAFEDDTLHQTDWSQVFTDTGS